MQTCLLVLAVCGAASALDVQHHLPTRANDLVERLWASPLQLNLSTTEGFENAGQPLPLNGSALPVQSSTALGNAHTAHNPNCTVALFSGQGFQHVGMGKATVAAVPAAEDLYRRASVVLGYDLLDAVMSGSQDLSRTDIAQPAILVASLAAVEKYKAQHGNGAFNDFCAALGFSIGEYAALTFAGVLSFEDAVRLTQLRGAAMIEASQQSEQSMITVDGPPTVVVETVCREVSDLTGGYVAVANYMSPSLHVISGDAHSCAEVERLLKAANLTKRTRKLAVSGAFHSPFMSAAQTKLKHELAAVTFNKPWLPLMFNVDGAAHADPSVMRILVEQQVSSPVRLSSALVAQLMKGVRSAVEFGPASGVASMFKRVATEVFGAEAGNAVSISRIL